MSKRSAPSLKAYPNKGKQEQSYVYTIGKRQAIVTPVYKNNGENICDILLKLMCKDEED